MSDLAVEGGEPIEEPGVEAPEEATPEAAAPEVPTLDPLELQAELEHTRGQYNQVLGILEQISQQQNQPVQQTAQQAGYDISSLTDEYGNLDPQKFAAFQAQRDSAIVSQMQQMFQPLQQSFSQQQEAAQVAEGQERLKDIVADDIARNGEFATDAKANEQAQELVMTLASNAYPDFEARYGATPHAAELAMRQAMQTVRGFIGSVGGSAVAQTQDNLATLAGAHGEPGAGGAGVEAPVIRNSEQVGTLAARYAAGGHAT